MRRPLIAKTLNTLKGIRSIRSEEIKFGEFLLLLDSECFVVLFFIWKQTLKYIATNLIHYTITFILLKLKASTCFGHHLPILRRQYTNTVLVGVACCYRCRLFTLPILRRCYTNTVLVGIACCYRCRLFTLPILRRCYTNTILVGVACCKW
jgi:hypothetical protein